jgi:hypothetical protein
MRNVWIDLVKDIYIFTVFEDLWRSLTTVLDPKTWSPQHQHSCSFLENCTSRIVMFFGLSSVTKILENRFFGNETREQDEHVAILDTRMAIDYYALDSDHFEMLANYINILWTYYSDPSIPTFYSLVRKAKSKKPERTIL